MSTATAPESTVAPLDLEPRAYARAVRKILLILIGVGVALRIVRLVIPSPIWGDEAMLGLNFLEKDYSGLAGYLDMGQVAPVFFLWTERFVVLTLGTADWLVRLVPFLTSVGALFLMWDFARRTVSPTAATLAVGLLSVAIWPVLMAATVKPYSGDLFWSLLLLALAARWHQRPERLAPLIGLVASVPLALGNSYPAVFVAGAVSLYLLPVAWKATRSIQGLFLAYNLAMMGTFLAIYFTVAQAQVDPNAGSTGSFMRWYWRNGFPPESALDFPLWFLQAHSGRMFAYPVGDSNGGSSATTLLFLLGVWCCWRGGSRPLLVLCLVPFALNLLAAVLGKYPYAGCCRLSQHLAPAICLLAGVGWAHVMERFSPRREGRLRLVQWAAAGLILLGTIEVIHRCVKMDHDPAARFASHLYDELQLEVKPGDRVVVASIVNFDVCTQWYLRRFGDQLVILHPGDALPEADRLFMVSMTPTQPVREDHETLIRSAKGWKQTDTIWFYVRPDGNADNVWWNAAVTCMVRPGDTRTAPRMNAIP